ncbi:hypothetical protein SAMN06265795_103125 [Noviherbaspirillum humi]|uniref:DNA-binding protein n=1 Tax=Noviherbaspirillum humi TaxID=1688639 RepID=A0A239F2A7_9BURK|nr:hypothetical protein [Noviherbaspirillum humi]SNS50678.1 hypothetical protein SAMN06265795_103125 [Noviherbaspirillum humi]
MSSLIQARDSIKAELAQAMQGVDFYQRRIEALEKALDDLEQIPDLETGGAQESGKARRGRPARAAKQSAPKKSAGAAKRGRAAKSGGGELPATGGSFWMELVDTEPRTAPQILEAATQRIGTSLSPELRKKLAQRMVMALRGMVKSGAIKDSGKGRQRQFYQG